MTSRAARLAEIRALRASGKTAAHTYVPEEVEQLYDEVNDEDYKKLVRGRLDRDDFVVDDNGEGYIDDGREEWDNEHSYGSDSEEDGITGTKSGKRKREDDQEQRAKIRNGISKYFNNKSTAHSAPKPKPVSTREDEDFMADLLGEVDVNITRSKPTRMKPVKSESRRKTRVLSPPIQDLKSIKIKQEVQDENTPMIEDDYTPLPNLDDDVVMSDPFPSSPIGKAVERKAQIAIKKEPKIEEEEEEVVVEQEEADDEDEMEVTVAVAGSTNNRNINMSSSRPAPKIKKEPLLPTPASSSPIRQNNIDAASWTSVTNKLNVASSPVNTQITTTAGKLKPELATEEDGSLNMFWFDYTEIRGSLCLFGKVKDKSTGGYASCFVKIDNIQRKLFFLPRKHRQVQGIDQDEEISTGDVYEEVVSCMSKIGVDSYKVKPCFRKYAFELPNIPKESEYLKLLYPYDKPILPSDSTGATYSHVFGTNTALFEQFVLWKNIMGPCWINIKTADYNAVTNASWCKLELSVNKPEGISVIKESDSNLQTPPMTLMSIALRTTYNAKDNKQEILMASARVYENVSITDTTPAEQLPSKTFTIMRPIEEAYPTGFKMDAQKHKGIIGMERNEASLLSKFMAMLGNADPDILMGHKLDDVDISVLLSRLKERKTPGWHRVGRLRRSEWPKSYGKGGGFFLERQLMAGRLLCDLANEFAKPLMSKCLTWDLTEMCDLILRTTRKDIDNDKALKDKGWATEREGLMQYLTHCEADTYFVAAIALKIQMLPLSKQLTNLAGNSWARTLTGTRAERNEYILLHEFTKKKYICPDKSWGKQKTKSDEDENEEGDSTKKKDKYKGGLVFEPEKGLYDKFILVMDFNSLYPSIIQEFNICFTTVERSDISEEEERVPEIPSEQDLGVLPQLLSTLVKRRREVKKLMKDKSATPDQLATWDIRQLALKLTANSMYGCLGYTKSRFYARPLAMLTTFKGREILQSTKNLAENMQLRVIYGDTDSVMINTNMDNIQEALKFGREFKKSVNDQYKLLEIDIDNIFKKLLLHAKKKYAALNMIEIDGKWEEKIEVKGLDMRRREYCQLSKETSTKLLEFLLSGDDSETVINNIHEHLRQLASNMREYKIPVPKYTIRTQLGKDPKDYPNANSMPSVQVALKLQAKGKHVKAKDVMSFVITGESNGSAESAASNAYPFEDIIKPDNVLKPDINYYLHKQILPPVERLCAPVSGTNITQLADCLGLDTSKYRVSTVSGDSPTSTEVHPLESQIPDSIRFKDVAPLVLKCRGCKNFSLFRGLNLQDEAHEESAILSSTKVTHDGLTCPNCNVSMTTLSVSAQVDAHLRSHVAKYYQGWLICDDAACQVRTRQMSVFGSRCLGGSNTGCGGKMRWEYGERALYNQILYVGTLFDTERMRDKAKKESLKVEEEAKQKLEVLVEVNKERLEKVSDVVKAWQAKNGRQIIQMNRLFGFVNVGVDVK